MANGLKYCSIVIIIALIDLSSSADKPKGPSELPKRAVKCSMKKITKDGTKNGQIRVNSPQNVTDTPIDDISWTCQNTPCGRQATELILQKPSKCFAEQIKDNCPQIELIIMDDKRLCSCYCEIVKYVRGSGSGFTNCGMCGGYPPTVQPTPSAVDALALREQKDSSLIRWQGLEITMLSVSIPSVLLAFVVAYCYRGKCNKGINLFRGRGQNQAESQPNSTQYTRVTGHHPPASIRSLDAESLRTSSPLLSAGRRRDSSSVADSDLGNSDHRTCLLDLENDIAARRHVANSSLVFNDEESVRNNNMEKENNLLIQLEKNTDAETISLENLMRQNPSSSIV